MNPGPDLKEMFLKVCLHWSHSIFHLMYSIINHNISFFLQLEFRSFMVLRTRLEKKTGNDFRASFLLPFENVCLLTMGFEDMLQ